MWGVWGGGNLRGNRTELTGGGGEKGVHSKRKFPKHKDWDEFVFSKESGYDPRLSATGTVAEKRKFQRHSYIKKGMLTQSKGQREIKASEGGKSWRKAEESYQDRWRALVWEQGS